MSNPPSLTWQSQKVGLHNTTGNTAKLNFSFGSSIKNYAIGLSAFSFSLPADKGIYLQHFTIDTSVLSVEDNNITIRVKAAFVDHETFNFGGWVRVTVLAWVDDGDGHPPVLLANRKAINSGQTSLNPITIPMQANVPEFVIGKDRFSSFLSGFQLSLGTPDLQNNPLTSTYISAGAGLVTLDNRIDLSGEAEIRGVGTTTVYQTNIPEKDSKPQPSVQDNKTYRLSVVKSGTVDAACCILSKELEEYTIAPISITVPNTIASKANQYPPKVSGDLPFKETVKDFVFLIQSFTMGKIQGGGESATNSILNLDVWQDEKNPSKYVADVSTSYYVPSRNDNSYQWGFSNVNGLFIAKL